MWFNCILYVIVLLFKIIGTIILCFLFVSFTVEIHGRNDGPWMDVYLLLIEKTFPVLKNCGKGHKTLIKPQKFFGTTFS